MDNSALSKLSPEQLAFLDDELKAVFCALKENDQVFFAANFKPQDLAAGLVRKGEIMRRNQGKREELDRLVASFKDNVPPPIEGDGVEGALAAAAGALGLGTAAAVVATDNTGFYQGVKPYDLVEPLRTEFEDPTTSLSVTGSADALTATVFLLTNTGRVPAMTMNLTTLNNGCEVRVNDLSTQGVLQAIKNGGGKILEIAGKGLGLFYRSRGRVNPLDLVNTASQTLASGAGLAESVHTLKLKDRAWKVIKQTGEAIEANYRDRLEKQRQAQDEIENAWNHYRSCPNCGVSFAPEDTLCRVCGTGRPDKPQAADPRLPPG